MLVTRSFMTTLVALLTTVQASALPRVDITVRIIDDVSPVGQDAAAILDGLAKIDTDADNLLKTAGSIGDEYDHVSPATEFDAYLENLIYDLKALTKDLADSAKLEDNDRVQAYLGVKEYTSKLVDAFDLLIQKASEVKAESDTCQDIYTTSNNAAIAVKAYSIGLEKGPLPDDAQWVHDRNVEVRSKIYDARRALDCKPSAKSIGSSVSPEQKAELK